jgi:very-short-patch-repair endonuclease
MPFADSGKGKLADGVRQQKMGRFIVDFFCADHQLVVEIDGGVHEGRAEHDVGRQRALELIGVRVVRFSADDVGRSLSCVLTRIRALLEEDGETEMSSK